MKNTICNECLFFKQINMEVGECRRHPPTIVGALHERSEDVNEEVSFMTRWPVIAGDDWCGEFSFR